MQVSLTEYMKEIENGNRKERNSPFSKCVS